MAKCTECQNLEGGRCAVNGKIVEWPQATFSSYTCGYSPRNINRFLKNTAETGRFSGMHDSGKREEFDTGAVRDTAEGKPRPDLISPYAQMRKGEWLRKGAEKYAERNWEKGMKISRCIASIFRHLFAYMMGKRDEDHLAAIAVNAEFIMHYEKMIEMGILPADLDDMPKYEQQKKEGDK